MTLYINAPNVHQGGGRALLESLFVEVPDDTLCILDERIPKYILPKGVEVLVVKATLWNRLKAEVFLRKQAKSVDTILCFGNLPPLFRSSASVRVFLQNRYLFGAHNLSKFSVVTRLRLHMERIWFQFRMRPEYQVIVQSRTMQRELNGSLGFDSIVLPFVASYKEYASEERSCRAAREFDFVYVSSAEPHKNHSTLLDAWVILAEQGLRPSLALTVSSRTAPRVAQLIDRMTNLYGLNIVNFGTLERGSVQDLYNKSSALIFPSALESFGLPLIEAKTLGMGVLAPELDYVRDVVQPDQTFNSESPISIARAVMRYLAIPEQTVRPLTAKAFVKAIQSMGGM